MSRKDLQDFLDSHTPEEQAERQALKAYLTVLKHKAVLDAVDIDALAEIARNPKASTRDRVRAGEMLAAMRQKSADGLAQATAIREDVMDAKGLKQGGPQSVTLNFSTLDPEKLKALAEGKPLLPEGPKVVEVEPEEG